MVANRIFRTITSSCLLAAVTSAHAASNVAARVTERVNASDCVGAVHLLKTGLADNDPGAALLAGTMYERGICLKQNWDSAVGNYILAHDAGDPAAAYRLAAGYATPLAGPDPAAALWWMSKSGGKSLQEPCQIPESERADPDRFVAVLQKWTPARIAGCNYVVGVVASVAGDVQFSREIVMTRQAGTLIVRFTPAQADVDVWTTTSGGVFSSAMPNGLEQTRRATRQSGFENGVKKIAERALARYPQPPGLDPVWTQYLGITFGSTR